MRVLLITLGSLGDLLPFLTLGKALRSRGHEVCIGTSSQHEPLIRQADFEFHALLDSAPRPAQEARFRDPNRDWALGWAQVLAPAMAPAFELIRDKSQQGYVVAAHWAAFGARLAEEKLGVPTCTVYLSPEALNPCDESGAPGPRWRGFSEDEAFGPLLNQYRGELGLPAVDHICSRWVHSPRLGLALFPEWFCSRPGYWPQQVTTTGFVTSDEAIMPVATQRVEAFLDTGAPPIVFTPGTGMPLAASFFKESLAACAILGARAILLTPYSA